MPEPQSLEGLVEHLANAQDDAARAARTDARRADAARFAAAERALHERARASKLTLAKELVGHGVRLGTTLASASAQGAGGAPSEAEAAKLAKQSDAQAGARRARQALVSSASDLAQTGLGHAAGQAEQRASAASLSAERHERLAADARDQATRESSVRDQLLRAFEAAAAAAREGDRLAAGR